MTPLALSGPLLIGVVVIISLTLLWVLLRGEADYVEESPDEQSQQDPQAPDPEQQDPEHQDPEQHDPERQDPQGPQP